jgi:hypothetical protein
MLVWLSEMLGNFSMALLNKVVAWFIIFPIESLDHISINE